MARGQRGLSRCAALHADAFDENSGTHGAGAGFYFGVVGADGLEPPTYAL